mmetsp:Transcript_31300/g.61451  ORF Transcript_31300/g.61451 Transcript_31300/m.61451 type:complete len:222 (-) Transcript_31300:1005-1670(-)
MVVPLPAGVADMLAWVSTMNASMLLRKSCAALVAGTTNGDVSTTGDVDCDRACPDSNVTPGVVGLGGTPIACPGMPGVAGLDGGLNSRMLCCGDEYSSWALFGMAVAKPFSVCPAVVGSFLLASAPEACLILRLSSVVVCDGSRSNESSMSTWPEGPGESWFTPVSVEVVPLLNLSCAASKGKVAMPALVFDILWLLRDADSPILGRSCACAGMGALDVTA